MKRIINTNFPTGITWGLIDPMSPIPIYRGMQEACFGNRLRGNSVVPSTMKAVIYFNYDHLQYLPEDFNWWVNFLTECGFPSSVGEDVIIDDVKYLTLEAQANNYSCYIHWFAGLTALRLPGYKRTYLPDIPEKAFGIKNMFPEEDSFKCLVLAHFAACNGQYDDASHTLIHHFPFRLLSKEQSLKRMKSSLTINDACSPPSNLINTVSNMQIYCLTGKNTKESYSELFKLLK